MNETLFWLTYLAVGLITGLAIASVAYRNDLGSNGVTPVTAGDVLGEAILPGFIVLAFVFLWPLLVAILALGYLVVKVIK